MPASAVKVEPVTTVDTQLRPPAVAAITPEPLKTLLVICPLIILFYALVEKPAIEPAVLAVPTAAVSLATTPLFETKFVIPVFPPLL